MKENPEDFTIVDLTKIKNELLEGKYDKLILVLREMSTSKVVEEVQIARVMFTILNGFVAVDYKIIYFFSKILAAYDILMLKAYVAMKKIPEYDFNRQSKKAKLS